MGIHFEKFPDLWVCFCEVSRFIGMLLRNSQIVYLKYLENAMILLLFVKSHQNVPNSFPTSGLMGVLCSGFPDLWVKICPNFRVYVHHFLKFSGSMRLVIDTEWHKPVSPSTNLPPPPGVPIPHSFLSFESLATKKYWYIFPIKT